MSIVGTRPPLISETNLYEPHHKVRLTKIISKKYSVEVIDYKPDKYDYLYGLYRPWNTMNNIKYNLKRIPLRKEIKNQAYLFERFREKQLSLNLYTIDLICHGSPSPQILSGFLHENNVDIQSISELKFRNKEGFGLQSGYKRISFDDESDLYTFAFLTSLDYTENCYSCRYATLDRVSDITLGDSWGSELEAEEQKKGISLILCQTEKGKELLKNTKIELRDVNLNKAVKANHQLSYPSKMPTERKIFFKNIDKGFYHAISRCHPKMYYIRRLKYILHKAKIIRGGAAEIKIDMYDMTYKN